MVAKRGSLKKYKAKRDFSLTAEPKGAMGKKSTYRYLIQKHDATRLHYDFRLELDGVLKSWAVTRGPSLDPADKRLAVEVEDHPVEYGSFEGTIPKGQYGGGTVMLWDQGAWEPIGDARKGLAKGKLEFILRGKRLGGEWTLVRMKQRERDRGRSNWLLIKRHDKYARANDGGKFLEKNITSIVTGRAMDEIAAANDAKKPAAKKTKMPQFFAPQLATLVDVLPTGKEWVHEIKFDGYRLLAHIKDGKVTLYTRTGQDWTHKFKSIATLLEKFPAKQAIVDGEVVALNEEGVSSFKMLQQALSEGKDRNLQYYAFDLLYLNGEDLTDLKLVERKARLEPLLQLKKFQNHIFYSQHFADQDDNFLRHACGMHLEGVVSKRADAPYRTGRTKSWVKTKCHTRQEFVIGGFTLPTHAERGIGALLIGYYRDEELHYAGKVGTGFDNETSLALRKRLDRLEQDKNPFAQVPADGKHGAHWVKPELLCEVEFTEWTADGRLRHPSYQGLREDKPAKTVRRDKPQKISAKDAVVGGIQISHPDRIIYPKLNFTKKDLAEYYLSIAERILPHVANRPLSMLRCPEGIAGECFFQRHIAHNQSPHFYDTGIEVKGRNETYVMIKDEKGLIALVQWGVIELHPWGCTAKKPDKPDRIIFDLDPDAELPWDYVLEGIREVKTRMKEFGLRTFLKTTGGKGLHAVIPIVPQYGWPTIKAFTRAVAQSMAHDNPKRYVATAVKTGRKGKIFVDYLRNDLTATSVAPFSARAREGAGVAAPLFWEELKPSLRPSDFTVATIHKRLDKDPWADFFQTKQKIPAKYLKALKIEMK